MNTKTQKIAISAYKRVQKIQQNKDKAYQAKYRTMSKKLPVLIRTTGLSQALAFVLARGKDESEAWTRLLNDIADTLKYENVQKLAKQSREADMHNYIFLTHQMLSALLWYKRFAETMLSDDSPKKEIPA